MLHKTTQLSVMAVAALAIVAVVAVALFAAGGAQAENVTTNALPYESGNGGSNDAVQPQRGRPTPTPTPEPTAEPTPQPHPTPEACADPPADVVIRGSVALFDVYWDDNDKNLNNNPCPPTVRHEDVGDPPVEVTHRSPSKVNIGHTIVHIRDLAKHNLVKVGDPTPAEGRTLTVSKDSPLWQAYDGQPETGRMVWFLPVFESEEQEHMQEEAFHLGFSAGLLRAGDWVDNFIYYEFEANRELDVAPNDRGAILIASDNSFLTRDVVQWDTLDPDQAAIVVPVGQYEHRAWAFTRPGTYVVSVHAKGSPEPHLGADPKVRSVTSEVRTYKFHVGLLADVNVEIAASDAAPNPGGTVEFTVTARNVGPDVAPEAVVDIEIPHGLTVDTATGDIGIYDETTGKWSIGDMAGDPDASETLTITASVAPNTHGEELTVNATIKATETIGSSEVTELDPNTHDNTSTVVITPTAEPNENVMLGVAGRLAENAGAGTPVTTGPWVAYDPDSTAFKYSLTGDDADQFVVNEETGAISVADGADLNYECKTAYVPRLQVSDGKDEVGNADDWAVDSVLAMVINLDDQQEPDPQVQISVSEPDDRGRVTLTPVVTPGGTLCAPLEDYSYVWDGSLADKHRNDAQVTVSPFGNYDRYTVRVTITDANGRSVTVQDSVTLSE